jgi:hypothetical protein
MAGPWNADPEFARGNALMQTGCFAEAAVP